MPKKIAIITLAVIALVAVAGAAIFIAQQKQERAEKGREVEEQIPNLPELTEKPWKTYQNTKYGFEIQYPNDWIIKEGEATSDSIKWGVLEAGEEVPYVMEITISERKGKTFNEWIKEKEKGKEDFPYEVIKTIKVAGIEGIIVRDPVTMGQEYHIAVFPVKNYMFEIGISSFPPEIPENPVDLLTKILATFKLTDEL